jgi:hypothetical protein
MTASNAVASVTVVYTKFAVGVLKAVVLVDVGAIQSGAPVKSTPPALYPAPETSPVAVYTVFDAFVVAETR